MKKKSCSDVLLLLLVTFTLIDVFKNASFNLLVFYQCLLENMYVPIYTGNPGNSGKIRQPGKTRTVRCSVKENPDRPVFGKNETRTARNPEKQVFAHHYRNQL